MPHATINHVDWRGTLQQCHEQPREDDRTTRRSSTKQNMPGNNQLLCVEWRGTLQQCHKQPGEDVAG